MLFALTLLALPALIIWLAARIPALDRIGVVPLTFAIGFALALSLDLSAFTEMQTTVQEVSVALALPLILFAANLRRALTEAHGAGLAMALSLISVCIASLLGVLLFQGRIVDLPQVAGMAVGAYTGSGVNMGAIKSATGASDALFLTMVTYDIVFSIGYMMVILLVGQRLAGLILPPFVPHAETDHAANAAHIADDSAHGYARLIERSGLLGSALAFGAAALCVGVAVVLAGLLPEAWSGTATILLITTFGLLGAFVPRLHTSPTSFHLGMYLILIFCLSSATLLDLSVLTGMNWALGGYFAFILLGAMALHALLCRLFGIDRDTYLVASGAAIMSVPFIPVICGALRNRSLLVPGIAIAILGYAVGNYLGVFVAELAGAL